MKKVEIVVRDNIEYRKCNQCGSFLTKDCYYNKCKNNPNWVDSICKSCRKNKSIKRQSDFKDDINKKKREKILKTKGYKSPFNYVGHKYNVLDAIKTELPTNINCFVDLFCGSSTVTINTEAKKYICNDINKEVINFLNEIKNNSPKLIISNLNNIIDKFSLNTFEGFEQLKNEYNICNNFWYYYILHCYSFNQHVALNKKGECNSGYGNGISKFNFILEKRIKEYHDKTKNMDIQYISSDYKELLEKIDFKEDDFVFVDPPYLITDVNYSSNVWSENNEIELLKCLDEINKRGIRFMMSNVLTHKGNENMILKEWIKGYRVIELNNNFNRINKIHNGELESREVLIMNY